MSNRGIRALAVRMRHKVQVVMVDTTEFLGLGLNDSQMVRCRYVEGMLVTIDYPVKRLPWEVPLRTRDIPTVLEQDLSGFFNEVSLGLAATHWCGEELIISPSLGNWILIHYYKDF